jgi:hypothetical protein
MAIKKAKISVVRNAWNEDKYNCAYFENNSKTKNKQIILSPKAMSIAGQPETAAIKSIICGTKKR